MPALTTTISAAEASRVARSPIPSASGPAAADPIGMKTNDSSRS